MTFFTMFGPEDEKNFNEFTVKLDEITGLIDVTKTPVNMTEKTNANGFWKYNEDKILKQLEEYIAGTYSQHYVDRTGGGTEQTLDKIKHNRREGFCAGKPVITSNLSPMKDIAKDAAILVDPHSISSIRDGVNEVIKNPELRQSKVEKGKLIAQLYQSKKILNEYENLWKQVQDSNEKAAF